MFPKEDYTKALADHITVSVEDLSPTEVELINKSYSIFNDRLSDLKSLQDEVKRLSIELANHKAMTENDTRQTDQETYMDGESCPTCGRDNDY